MFILALRLQHRVLWSAAQLSETARVHAVFAVGLTAVNGMGAAAAELGRSARSPFQAVVLRAVVDGERLQSASHIERRRTETPRGCVVTHAAGPSMFSVCDLRGLV